MVPVYGEVYNGQLLAREHLPSQQIYLLFPGRDQSSQPSRFRLASRHCDISVKVRMSKLPRRQYDHLDLMTVSLSLVYI